MKTTHSYDGLGAEYLKARSGSPRFAKFLVSQAGFDENKTSLPLTLVELGVGSGQQTEYVEKELLARGITQYKILAYDKSLRPSPTAIPGQLDILKERIKAGEISPRVIPVHLDFDGAALALDSESVDLVYMGHVFHHLTQKEKVLGEIARILRKDGRLFILGVTLEDMVNHPLDEFFPTKYDYEIHRYPEETRLKNMMISAGLTYEKPFRTGRHNIRPIDRDFLASVENTTMDSALKIMKDEDPAVFQEGVTKVRREVERGEKSGKFRIYQSAGRLRVFWGKKIKGKQVKPTNQAKPEIIVLRFNDYINGQELEGLSSMMTDDHTLIDPGNTSQGRERVTDAWRRFFDACPDYQNHFEKIESDNDYVKVTGHATCSHKELNGPFLWTARVRGDKVAEWYVCTDTPENRTLLGIR